MACAKRPAGEGPLGALFPQVATSRSGSALASADQAKTAAPKSDLAKAKPWSARRRNTNSAKHEAEGSLKLLQKYEPNLLSPGFVPSGVQPRRATGCGRGECPHLGAG